jgi:hypothetical protein
MAREVQLFVSLPDAALAQALTPAIHALFRDTPFTLVAACTQLSLAAAMQIYDSFHPTFTLTDQWNPSDRSQTLPPHELEQLSHIASLSQSPASTNKELATYVLDIMRATQSLFSRNTVVCAAAEEVMTALQTYHLDIKYPPFFLAIERLGSVRRRILVQCSSAEELAQWTGLGGWQQERPFLAQLAQHTTLAVQQALLSLLPANSAQMGDVVETVTQELTVISQQVAALYGKLMQKRQELATHALKINSEADQIAVQIEQLAGKQDQIRLDLADKLTRSATDLSSAITAFQALESSPYITQPQALPPVPKRFPFKTLNITAYPTKILAEIQCFKHYQSSVYLSITSQGRTYKEDVKMINPGGTEMEVCSRSELAAGEYWLSFSSYPDNLKQLAQAFRFTVTPFHPQSHEESFLYKHYPDVQWMENSLTRAGGAPLLEAFRGLTVLCTDTDINRNTLFIEIAQNTPDPAALKGALESQGFTFLS